MKKCSPTAPPLNNLPWAQSAICLCSIYNIHRCGSWVSVMWIVLNRGTQLPSVLQWKHMVNLWRSFFFFFFFQLSVLAAQISLPAALPLFDLASLLPYLYLRSAALSFSAASRGKEDERKNIWWGHLNLLCSPPRALADAFSHRLLLYRQTKQ